VILKKAFDLNIGGMQTKFFKFIGTVKYEWSKFMVQFNKFLMDYGPQFNALFDGLLKSAMVGIRLVKVFAGAFFEAVKPVIPMFFKLNKMISELFSGDNKGLIDALTMGAKIAGTILGVFLKVQYILVISIVGVIVRLTKMIIKLVQWFLKIPIIGDVIKGIFEFIYNYVKELVKEIMTIVDVATSIADWLAFGDSNPESNIDMRGSSPVEQAPAVASNNSNVSSSNTYNQQVYNNTINTSQPPEKVLAKQDQILTNQIIKRG